MGEEVLKDKKKSKKSIKRVMVWAGAGWRQAGRGQWVENGTYIVLSTIKNLIKKKTDKWGLVSWTIIWIIGYSFILSPTCLT